jgi:hypothetical protein
MLQHAGHEVDHLDLYAEGFDPVLGRAERLGYHEVPANRAPVEAYVTRLPFTLPALSTAEARNQHRDMLRSLGVARDTLWIAELGDSMAKRNRRAIWSAMNVPSEDAAISQHSLLLSSRGFRVVERVGWARHEWVHAHPRLY